MCLAKERDVDMILLAGDLFHENKPSRKSMYQVMRSLRMNCYGEKPCELEMLSDASENFQGCVTSLGSIRRTKLTTEVVLSIMSITKTRISTLPFLSSLFTVIMMILQVYVSPLYDADVDID